MPLPRRRPTRKTGPPQGSAEAHAELAGVGHRGCPEHGDLRVVGSVPESRTLTLGTPTWHVPALLRTKQTVPAGPCAGTMSPVATFAPVDAIPPFRLSNVQAALAVAPTLGNVAGIAVTVRTLSQFAVRRPVLVPSPLHWT